MPDGVSGGLAPIVTPLGEMLMFTIVGGDLTPTEQRTLLDWTIRPAIRGLPGVADLNVLGGFVRTFEVAPFAAAMAARGVTVEMLRVGAFEQQQKRRRAAACATARKRCWCAPKAACDRSRIFARSSSPRGTGIVRVGDVAEVRYGALPRNGVVVRNGEGEAVWGLVLGLRGADARTVVKGVKERLAELEPTLPKGARFEIFYDRSELIGKAVWTVQKVLTRGDRPRRHPARPVPRRSARRDRRLGHPAARRARDLRHHAAVGPLGEYHVARRPRDRHRPARRLRGRRRGERRASHGECA